MTTRTASRTTSGRSAPRRRIVRRRIVLLLVAAAATLGAALAPWADHAVQEAVILPLRHDDIIRQQAAEKDLDPALIAGVIFTESRFRDATSHAGAKGLMQLMPDTADYIARKSGGTAFVQGDLASPQVNIAYGSWLLRDLLDHYEGEVTLALAAYNAGQGNVDKWVTSARARGEDFRAADHIPFPETRAYVQTVLSARADYRREYADELGLG
jgi:soluble lytic murein transglycosylase